MEEISPLPSSRSKWPISEHFHGGSLNAPVDYENAISRILNSIQRYIDNSPGLMLQGRVDGVRIDYNPAQVDITGISQRLQTARHRGGFTTQTEYDDADVRDTWEYLLRPLIKWNHDVFTELPGAVNHDKSLHPNKKEFVSDTLQYSSCLAFLGEGLSTLDPFTHDKRDQVVAVLMHELRQQILKVAAIHPDLPPKAQAVVDELSGRPRKVWMKQWTSLSNDESATGFAARLRKSFDRPNLRHKEYEDLLEQQLYAFRRNIEGTSRPQDGGDWFQLEKSPMEKEEIPEEDEKWFL